MKKSLSIFILIMLYITGGVFAAGPGIITYQGTVTLPGGAVPADGTYDMKFSLWNIESGGTDSANKEWEETQSSASAVSITKGVFSVSLGSNTPFAANFFKDNSNLWLQVQVDLNKNGFEDEEIFSPRTAFTATPYAFHADTAATAASASDVLRIVKEFVAESGETITAGDVVSLVNGKIRKGVNAIGLGAEQVFLENEVYEICCAKISNKKFIIAFNDSGNSTYGMVVIGTISGSTVSFSQKYVFNEAGTYSISIDVLGNGKFVIAFRDYANTQAGSAIIGTLTRTGIDWGAKKIFNNAITDQISVSAISNSHFVVAYRDNGNSGIGTAIIGSVSVSTISYGAETIFTSSNSDFISSACLSPSNFVIAFRDAGGAGNGMVVIGNVSDTSITYGAQRSFNNTGNFYITVRALSNSKIVIAYEDQADSNYGTAIIGNVIGTAVYFGPEYVFNSTQTEYICLSILSENRFSVSYKDTVDNGLGKVVVGTVSETGISFTSEHVFNDAETGRTFPVSLTQSKFIIGYVDKGNSNFATAICCDYYLPFGIANKAGVGGESIPVILHGISGNHSSLDPGVVYYSTTGGYLTSIQNDFKIGTAVSDTELLLELGR